MTRSEQQMVAEWFKRNGGHASIVGSLMRAEKEFHELVEAVRSGEPIESAREECADVVLCLMMFAETCGFDLMAAVHWKHGINEQRKWGVDDAGCLHHIKGSDPRALEEAS